MIWLGQIGLGFVWGWYLGLLGQAQWKRPLQTILQLLLSTLFFILIVYWQSNNTIPYLFISFIVLGLIIHKGWLDRLKATSTQNLSSNP